MFLRRHSEGYSSGCFMTAEVNRDGNLQSWTTCQWNLAERDKSCWTVIYLCSTDSHTNQCMQLLINLWLSELVFHSLQQHWKQLKTCEQTSVWTKCYNLYEKQTKNICDICFLSCLTDVHLTRIMEISLSLSCLTCSFRSISMFVSSYFGRSKTVKTSLTFNPS